MAFHMRSGFIETLMFMTIFGLVLQPNTARVFILPGTCYDVNGYQVPDGYYEDPANCRKFYACGGGIAYRMDCGAGTIYNPESKSCDIHDDGRVCT